MFKKAAQSAKNLDGRGEAGDPGSQATQAPDIEFDRNPGLAGPVQFSDHLRVLQLIHLSENTTRATGFGVGDLPMNKLGKACPQIMGRNH